MISWQAIRAEFPATQKYVYLDAAEASPIPELVSNAAETYYQEMVEEGVMGWNKWEAQMNDARKSVAKLINADVEEIAFTINTSHGMNIVADILEGQGNVLTMKDEFPSSVIPWVHRGYDVAFVDPTDHVYRLKEIQGSISENTDILVTSHVQYCTGFKQNLAALGELCQENGLTYVVNATQSVGVMPIDVKRSKIDFLTFAAYKWLMTGFGIGVLYINKKWLGRMKTPVAGGESAEYENGYDNTGYTLKGDASVLEVGTPHFPNIIALGAALDFVNSIGIANIQDRIYELSDYLIKQLEELGLTVVSPQAEQHRSGITVVDLPNHKGVAERLCEKGIIVSSRKNGLHITTHIYNNRKDIDRLVSELKASPPEGQL